MKKYEHIENVLKSIDDLTPAKAPEDFYADLKGRLVFLPSSKWRQLLKIGVAAMLVTSLINLYILWFDSPPRSNEVDDFTSTYFNSSSDLIDYYHE